MNAFSRTMDLKISLFLLSSMTLTCFGRAQRSKCENQGSFLPFVPKSYKLPMKNIGREEEWQVGRSFHISDKALMARILSEEPDARCSILKLLAFFKRTENRFALKKIPDNGPVCDVPCCIPKYYSTNHSISLRGWGQLPKKHCVTELRESDNRAKELFKDMKLLVDGVNRVGKRVTKEVFKKMTRNSSKEFFEMWKEANAPTGFRFEEKDLYQQCMLYNFPGYRVDGYWSLGVAVTNGKVQENKPEWGRHYITEQVVVRENSTFGAFPIFSRDFATRKWVNSTTEYQMWGPTQYPIAFGETKITDIVAIKRALSAFKVLNEQAQDSIMISNILLLSLPLVGALIPISLFSDVNRFVAIFYAIGTDIWAALPLAVKATELLGLADKEHHSAVTYMYAMRESNTSLGVAQTWAARCRTKTEIRVKGLILLSAAITAMVAGLILELVAWRIVQRRKLLSENNESTNDALDGESTEDMTFKIKS